MDLNLVLLDSSKTVSMADHLNSATKIITTKEAIVVDTRTTINVATIVVITEATVAVIKEVIVVEIATTTRTKDSLMVVKISLK